MRLFKFPSESRGQGMVEFALVIPIVIAMIFGILELGWLLYNNHTVSNATREGARYAMVNSGERSAETASKASVQNVVNEYVANLTGSVIVESVAFEEVDRETMDPAAVNAPENSVITVVTVETSYQYEPLVGMITGIGSLTLTSDSTVIAQY